MFRIFIIFVSFSIGQAVFAAGGIEMIETERVCANYPDSIQCERLAEQARAYCSDNMVDRACINLHYLQKSVCTKNPDDSYCPHYQSKVSQYCKDSSDTGICLVEKVHLACQDNPDSEKCINTKENAKDTFCKNHPQSIPCL
ncbi:MAG: hypothetical protein AAGB35_02285 [Pseudomonadota bacterium]